MRDQMKAEDVGMRRKQPVGTAWPTGCGRHTEGGIKDDAQVSGSGSGLQGSGTSRGKSTGGPKAS